MISREREAQILRFYHVEKWRLNTIAVQLGVHVSGCVKPRIVAAELRVGAWR